MSNLISQNLPYVKLLSNNDRIPFQFIYENCSDNHYYLLEDGSICEFYKFGDCNDLTNVINSIPEMSVIQIYKLHISGSASFFICIQKYLDYKQLKPSWLYTIKHVLKGPEHICKRISKGTCEAVYAIKSIMPQTYETRNISDNDALNYIYDKNSSTIKTNLSIIKSGKKLASSLSIINLGTLPIAQDIISNYDYLQVVSLVKPSIDRSNLLRVSVSQAAIYISSMGESKDGVVHVHTITSADEIINTLAGGFHYCNCKYFLVSDSIDSLSNTIIDFRNNLNNKDIIEYNHTVSGENEYISAFPGNAVYSDHFTIISHYVAPILVNRLLSL